MMSDALELLPDIPDFKFKENFESRGNFKPLFASSSHIYPILSKYNAHSAHVLLNFKPPPSSSPV